MRMRGAILGSVLVSSFAVLGAAGEEGLKAFLARIQGLSVQERARAVKTLSRAERKRLHAEYRALDPEGRKAADQALGRRGTAAAPPPRAKRGGRTENVPGSIQYDTGVAHQFRVNKPNVVGNQFLIRIPGTVETATVQQVGTFGGTYVVAFGQPSGTVAPLLGYWFGQFAVGALVQLPLLPPLTTTEGLVCLGVLQSGSSTTPSSTWIAVAVDVNNGPAGFHGCSAQPGGSGFNPSPTVAPGVPFNAIFRVIASLVPVELMSFDAQ